MSVRNILLRDGDGGIFLYGENSECSIILRIEIPSCCETSLQKNSFLIGNIGIGKLHCVRPLIVILYELIPFMLDVFAWSRHYHKV